MHCDCEHMNSEKEMDCVRPWRKLKPKRQHSDSDSDKLMACNDHVSTKRAKVTDLKDHVAANKDEVADGTDHSKAKAGTVVPPGRGVHLSECCGPPLPSYPPPDHLLECCGPFVVPPGPGTSDGGVHPPETARVVTPRPRTSDGGVHLPETARIVPPRPMTSDGGVHLPEKARPCTAVVSSSGPLASAAGDGTRRVSATQDV